MNKSLLEVMAEKEVSDKVYSDAFREKIIEFLRDHGYQIIYVSYNSEYPPVSVYSDPVDFMTYESSDIRMNMIGLGSYWEDIDLEDSLYALEEPGHSGITHPENFTERDVLESFGLYNNGDLDKEELVKIVREVVGHIIRADYDDADDYSVLIKTGINEKNPFQVVTGEPRWGPSNQWYHGDDIEGENKKHKIWCQMNGYKFAERFPLPERETTAI